MASAPLPGGNDPLFQVPDVQTPEQKAVSMRWLFGVAGTWFVLSVMADTPSLRELASAFAVTVAVSATFVLWQDAQKEIARFV